MAKLIQLKDKDGYAYPISEVYTVAEHQIGLYGDRPLYEKILISNEFLSTYTFSDIQINNIVDFRGFVVRKDYPNIRNPIPSRLKNANYYIDLGNVSRYSSKIDIVIDWGPGYTSNMINQVYFIIKYTKTAN